MNILENATTQTCECGNDAFHIKSSMHDGRAYVWAECPECGRPTASVGDTVAQMVWEREQE